MLNIKEAIYHHIAESNWINLFVIIPILIYVIFTLYTQLESEKKLKEDLAVYYTSEMQSIRDELQLLAEKKENNNKSINILKEGDELEFSYGIMK